MPAYVPAPGGGATTAYAPAPGNGGTAGYAPAPGNGGFAAYAPAPGNGGMTGYAPAPGGGGLAAYAPAPGGRAAGPGYPPANGRPGPGYRQSNSGPMPVYQSNSGPMPVYVPPQGADAMAIDIPMPDDEHVPNGRRILGWLPFGQRIVLLPRGDDPDEELREHRDVSGGWLRPAVFGAMDGLVTNSSLIAGIGGGGGAHGAIVLTGIAGLIAGAFSMATGEYISVTSQNELTQAEIDLERKQHRRDAEGKRRRLTEVYIDKGVSPNLAEAVVRQISADRERAVATHVREELGIDPDDMPSPRTAAVASFAAFTVGALLPLSPFLLGFPVLKVALGLSAVAAMAGGAAVAKLTGRSMLMGGLRQFTAAALATGMAFVIGHMVGGHVG